MSLTIKTIDGALTVEDNYEPPGKRGQEVFLGLNEDGDTANWRTAQQAVTLNRSDVKDLRDWLDAWLEDAL